MWPCGQSNGQLLTAVPASYLPAIADAHSPAAVSAAHLFLQRTLYRINRLAFFWCEAAPPALAIIVPATGCCTSSLFPLITNHEWVTSVKQLPELT